MQLPIYILVAAVEIYILLIVANLFLLLHVRKQRKLARRQQEKLQHIVGELKQLALPPPAVKEIEARTYHKDIDAQLLATRNRYSELIPGGDIRTPLTTDSTAAAKSLWLRYRFLETESAAVENGDDPGHINWQVFEEALINLCTDNNPAPDDAELNEYKKRVDNLEKFKQLFFTMEQQWEEANAKAQEYYQQLLALSSESEDKQLFVDLLDGYRHAYSDVNASFELGCQGMPPEVNPSAPLSVQVTRINTQSSEEIIRLRNVAADQHRIINQLQRKLEDAVTAEAKDAVILELKQQLLRQTRFVNESETCIQVLEQELVVASEKISEQQQALLNAAEFQIELDRSKEILQQFAAESKSLVADIFELEKTNDELRSALSSAGQKEDTEEAKGALETLQTEFSSLKKQYLELETKYLNMKLGSQ